MEISNQSFQLISYQKVLRLKLISLNFIIKNASAGNIATL